MRHEKYQRDNAHHYGGRHSREDTGERKAHRWPVGYVVTPMGAHYSGRSKYWSGFNHANASQCQAFGEVVVNGEAVCQSSAVPGSIIFPTASSVPGYGSCRQVFYHRVPCACEEKQ